MAAPQFTPYFPEDRLLAPVLAKAERLIAACRVLAGMPVGMRAALGKPLRIMNSYYSNKIEGQHTGPAEIDRAIREQTSQAALSPQPDAGAQRRLRAIFAHIQAEEALERRGRWLSGAALKEIHAEFYRGMRPEDLVTEDGAVIVPGAYRTRDVTVGHYLPPAHEDIDYLMRLYDQQYAAQAGTEARQLIAIFCAHHRATWIHPFLDGNGRSARLQTHAALHAMGLTQGLWSLMRGMARQQEAYYAALRSADSPRRGDTDGRGVLSQEGLLLFLHFCLDTALDQVDFMGRMLDAGGLKGRLMDYLRYLENHPCQIGAGVSVIKPTHTIGPLHYLCLVPSMARAEFIRMTGLSERVGRRVLATLIHHEIVVADTPKGDIRMQVPQHCLRYVFPDLWVEAE